LLLFAVVGEKKKVFWELFLTEEESWLVVLVVGCWFCLLWSGEDEETSEGGLVFTGLAYKTIIGHSVINLDLVVK